VSRVAGTEHVPQRGWSADTSGGHKTVSEHPQREDLLPAHVIRQMRRQEAVLLHGTLPPIHLRLVRWWEDHELGRLVPTGDDGHPLPAPASGTCPVTPGPRPEPEPVVDPIVIAESVASLPRLAGASDDHSRAFRANARRGPAANEHPAQGQLDLPAEPTPPDGNRVAGNCERCGARVPVGAGRSASYGTRTVVFCSPSCPPLEEAPAHGPGRE
jgi:type IV secretion system protein VirD4